MDIRYAVRVFAFKDNKVACIKYKNINKDYFDIPGGKIEDGETEIQTCIREFKEETGMDATLVNPRFITGVDEALLKDLKRDHTLVVTLEDGVLDGGFGEKIARYYGASGMKVLNYGIRKEFADRYDAGELLRDNRLTAPQIVEDIKKVS